MTNLLNEMEMAFERMAGTCEGLDMALLTDEDEDYEEEEDFVDSEDEAMETDEMLKESKRLRVVSFPKS